MSSLSAFMSLNLRSASASCTAQFSLRHLRVVARGDGRGKTLRSCRRVLGGVSFALFGGERFRLGDIDVVMKIDVGQGDFPPFECFRASLRPLGCRK